MKLKNRKQKKELYDQKYSGIPLDYHERLAWLNDHLNLTDVKRQEIINKRDSMMQGLYYRDIVIKLYEEPEGSPRPRFRLINRKNFVNEAMCNGSFVHVFQPYAKEDNMYMQRMVGDDLVELNNMIHTPCIVTIDTYSKTPSAFSKTDTYLAEIGVHRPLNKPDWDNIGKKYSDMFNSNIWLDDTLVISGTVNKYYSILPRVEITVRYLNTLYTRYHYNSISKRVNNKSEVNYYGQVF